ncbi:MAG: nicotinate phosphoribosyltransferase [Phycisphaeraceae bacterium]
MGERRAAEPGPFAEGLFTDLYELTMAQAYDAEAMEDVAVFELFFRKLPASRNFVMAAGLADVLDYLEHFQFSEDDLAYLRRQGTFREPFLARLARLRFTGDVDAVPEGTLIFPNEPVVQVTAPLIEAQLIETLVLNQVHFQSVAATKAARCVLAAEGRTVVDFGSRRAHGIDAALKVARTSYLAGASGTSNVLAGKRYDIPIFGTMAHSYIQAHADEPAAFAAFARLYPETTLLVDTYDTLTGVRRVIDLARKLGERFRVKAVRLDSGDLGALAVATRRLLDQAGLERVKIFASSGLDEHEIRRLIRAGAPIDGFGVGTKLAVSQDAPDLDFAYKLVAYAGQPRTKLSAEKIIYPGRKQVFREVHDGMATADVLGEPDEPAPGRPLLQPVMRQGERLPAGRVTLHAARDHAARQLARLPEPWRSLDPADRPYPVRVSDRLNQRLRQLQARMRDARAQRPARPHAK